MSDEPVDASTSTILLSADDIRRAAMANVLSQDAAENLLQWAHDQKAALSQRTDAAAIQAVEQRKGLNLVTVAYYFGAMLMISACAWFLGDKWDALGSKGILITSLIYALDGEHIGSGSRYLRGDQPRIDRVSRQASTRNVPRLRRDGNLRLSWSFGLPGF
jgi:hypothetical protein